GIRDFHVTGVQTCALPILIDFPGFNLRVAEFAKKNGIRVCYYISPKVWAWNQKRVLKIKRVVDQLFCILPFEVDFYRSWGMEVRSEERRVGQGWRGRGGR